MVFIHKLLRGAKSQSSDSRHVRNGWPFPVGRHLGIFLCTLTVAFFPTGASRAAYAPDGNGWEDCRQFLELASAELGADRVRSISALDYSVLQPQDGIIFLYPEVEIRFHPLAAFLAAGGRAAVIDDHGEAESLLERFHIHRASAPTQPSLRLNGNARLPIAMPAASESAPGEKSDHPTLRGVDQVVTNHPTALRLEPGIELTNLLTIPASGEPDALLAVTGVIGDAQACGLGAGSSGSPPSGRCGRLLAMADPSVLINLMLRYPGNREFARGLVGYLVEDDAWGRRGGNLYVLAGNFRQIGSYGGADSWRDTLLEQGAALVAFVEELRDDGLPEPVSIALAALLGLGVAIWAGMSSGQPYAPAVPAYAQAVPITSQGGVAGRFAVLAAPSTDRALILLELQRTLQSKISQALGLPGTEHAAALLDRIAERRALTPARHRALAELFRRLSAAEVAVLSARRLTVSDHELGELHQRALDILSEMKHDGATTGRGPE